MNESLLIDRDVLLVDDEESTRAPIERYINGLDKKTRENYGIAEIHLKTARSEEEAKPHLKDAAAKPLDLVLLDLHLPAKFGIGSPTKAIGFRILRLIQETKAARGVIVISNYPDFRNARAAFTGGAVDFISKPFKKHHVEPAVLNTLHRLMLQESDNLLNQRIFELVAHSQLGLAHGFRQVFFKLIRDVSESAEGIERYASERYGLDRGKDPTDALTLLLNQHEQAISTAREEWARIQSQLTQSSTEFQRTNTQEVLNGISKALKPALVVKKLALEIPDVRPQAVHTFENDVEIVLREIIAGALNGLSNDGDVRHMTVKFVDEPTRVGVTFEDDLDVMPPKQVAAINEGTRIIPSANFDRVWGLSVAQHIALRGGGEIKIGAKSGKNIVTYFMPRADP